MKRWKPNPEISDREFYLRSFTWGLPVTLGGAIVAAGMLATGHKPEKYGNCIRFTAGKKWGGSSMGIFMITCENASRQLKEHEYGHSLQNCCYGPLMPVINLQSSARYLYRKGIQRLLPEKSCRRMTASGSRKRLQKRAGLLWKTGQGSNPADIPRFLLFIPT